MPEIAYKKGGFGAFRSSSLKRDMIHAAPPPPARMAARALALPMEGIHGETLSDDTPPPPTPPLEMEEPTAEVRGCITPHSSYCCLAWLLLGYTMILPHLAANLAWLIIYHITILLPQIHAWFFAHINLQTDSGQTLNCHNTKIISEFSPFPCH